jgi:hypothetical protein
MPTHTTSLFLLEDLEDVGKTSELAEGELTALQAVADWIKTYVVTPHKDLGRAGPVCPFVPGALERRTLWLAPVTPFVKASVALVRQLGVFPRRSVRHRETRSGPRIGSTRDARSLSYGGPPVVQRIGSAIRVFGDIEGSTGRGFPDLGGRISRGGLRAASSRLPGSKLAPPRRASGAGG